MSAIARSAASKLAHPKSATPDRATNIVKLSGWLFFLPVGAAEHHCATYIVERRHLRD
jgi:hypothetical protein